MRVLITAIAMILVASTAHADWQSTLAASFDHVETFDNLANWRGTCNSNYQWTGFPSGALFNGYDCEHAGDTANNWVDTFTGNCASGKCFSMDMYNNTGPGRLVFYIGDGTNSSGYDDAYIFYRVRFTSMFMPPGATDWGYFKWFVPSMGYTSASTWGSAGDQASACQDPQTLSNYGPNNFIMNWDYLSPLKNIAAAHPRPAIFSTSCSRVPGTQGYETDNSDNVGTPWMKDSDRSESVPGNAVDGGGPGTFDMYSLNNSSSVYGMEIHVKAGPDQGGTTHYRNLTYEYWLYSPTGTVLHHWLGVNNGTATNYQNNGYSGATIHASAYFPTHKYNRFELGGNQSISGGTTWPPSGRFYVDDVVINGGRIGPTYYALAGGTGINGSCGTASGGTFSSLTSSSPNLCAAGTVASFAGSGPWTWGCNGSGGGTSTSSTACSASLFTAPSLPATWSFTTTENPLNALYWTAPTGVPGLQAAGGLGKATVDGQANAMLWTVNTFNADQYAQAKLTTLDSGENIDLYTRASTAGSGYLVSISNGGVYLWQVVKWKLCDSRVCSYPDRNQRDYGHLQGHRDGPRYACRVFQCRFHLDDPNRHGERDCLGVSRYRAGRIHRSR